MIGSVQYRELICYDQADRNLKIYIYNEPNHNKPHIHVYFKKDYKVSIAIQNGDKLAGEIPPKNLKVIRKWIDSNKKELLKAWRDIQNGTKPELKWSKFA